MIRPACSHGIAWDARCVDCEIVSLTETVERFGPMVERALKELQKLRPEPPSHDWSLAPADATHYQPHQRAYYKRVSATEWFVWSRLEREAHRWMKSPAASDNAVWIKRPSQPSGAQGPCPHCGAKWASVELSSSPEPRVAERLDETYARIVESRATPPPGDDARLAIEELKNIINARRRDRDNFADDTEFADWVLSRARYTLGVIERASETKCAVCNDTGSVQDSEVPYLGNPCPECK